VRLSEFWERMDEAFGAAYSRSVAHDQVLRSLGGRTVTQALGESGDRAMSVRQVWRAVCADLEVPARLR